MERTEPCGFERSGRCTCTNGKRCNGCAFYKTEAQIKKGRIAALRRLTSLPNAEKLLEKYYDIKIAKGAECYYEQ